MMSSGGVPAPPPTKESWDDIRQMIRNTGLSISKRLEELDKREAEIAQASQALTDHAADLERRTAELEARQKVAFDEVVAERKKALDAIQIREAAVAQREKALQDALLAWDAEKRRVRDLVAI